MSERWITEETKSASRTAWERDRDRVLHSAALRRLGAKTQVLGPESNDFVRTRLTHSLEVAQIGRSLAKNLEIDPVIVETACLSHDLGHPPFGHNGERALAEVAADAGGFEGNAQTLRILTRLEPKVVAPDGSPAGLNLTRATLDSVIKYPWAAGEGPTRPDGTTTPKFNVYQDDLPIYRWVRSREDHRKCIEAQTMDLADDIAYSTHDVEDGIVRGLIRPDGMADDAERERIIEATASWYRYPHRDRLADAMDRLVRLEQWPSAFGGTYAELAAVKDLTSDLIGRFISAITEATGPVTDREAVDLVVPQETLAEIIALKGLAVTYVMLPRESEPLYFEQRTVLFDLVDALLDAPEKLEPQFLEEYRAAVSDAERMRAVVDQVASLTDQSARQWHSHLCGFLRH